MGIVKKAWFIYILVCGFFVEKAIHVKKEIALSVCLPVRPTVRQKNVMVAITLQLLNISLSNF